MSPIASTQQAVIMTKDCKHNGAVPVKIGPYMVHLAREREISYDLTASVDYVVPLNGNLPAAYFGSVVKVIHSPLKDFGGVPEFWPKYIADVILNFLAKDKKLLAWCTGSHGRTGCWAASLISVLEPETDDPIAAIRERHCKHAVETMAQAVAIFALRGESLPEHYVNEFTPKPVYVASSASSNLGKDEIPKGCSPVPTVKIGSQEFIQSSNLTELLWKPVFGNLSPKLLNVVGAWPTNDEYQVFMGDASYHGFKLNVTPKTEVAISFEGYDFIETEDKTCLVSKFFNTADRYMLNITTDMPTKDDYVKFLNDSHIRGFRRVKAGKLPTVTVEEVVSEDELSHVIDNTQLAYEVYDTSSVEDSPEETPEVFVEIEGEHTFVVEEVMESGNYFVYLTLFEPVAKTEMTTDEFESLPYMHIPKGSKINEYNWIRFVDEARFKGFKVAWDWFKNPNQQRS